MAGRGYILQTQRVIDVDLSRQNSFMFFFFFFRIRAGGLGEGEEQKQARNNDMFVMRVFSRILFEFTLFSSLVF